MNTFPEGQAVIYCEGSYGTTNGKTAHGLVRRTRRYAENTACEIYVNKFLKPNPFLTGEAS